MSNVVKELVQAKWIKPRRETTQVFMIRFMNNKLPEFIRIPGEAVRTKVYEQRSTNVMQEVLKIWIHREEMSESGGFVWQMCWTRTSVWWLFSEVVKCGSCGGAHISGHTSGFDRKKQQTILEIQKQQKVG